MPSVFFYVSGHGFGHASRQIEIINALRGRLPLAWQIAVRTDAAPRLFERTARPPITLLPGECDTGVIQVDSLRLDEAATAREAARFYATFESRAADEARLLRTHDARLVLADAPPLGLAAAAAAGVESIVVGNFTWNWIYEGYGERFTRDAPDVLPVIRDAYRAAGGGWRLPMHGGFATVSPVEDLPFVARHAAHSRDQVLGALGIPSDRPVVLSSFGGFGLSGFDIASVDCLGDYTVVITRWQDSSPPPARVACVDEGRMYALGFRYEDLVAAADAVVTKPGYGIVSECIANGTAILYTSRGRFVEYDVLVREMPRYLRCTSLDQDALLAGRWRDALDALLEQPAPPERPRTDGADAAAAGIMRRLSV